MRSALGHRLLALAISGSCLLSAVTSSPLSLGRRLAEHKVSDLNGGTLAKSRRQDNGHTPLAITGIAQADVQVRLEVRELAKTGAQWNLFVLGMQKLQQMDQDERTSWYSISGIHGMPFVPWDGVESKGSSRAGYCTHSSNLFLPWHRPYIALWEQTLQGLMLEIANDWPAGPERDEQAAAANTFRFPYWDWAVVPPEGETNVPVFLTAPNINVTLHNGTETIHNPLYSYKFNPLDHDALYSQSNEQFSIYTQTMRYPTTKTADAKIQDNGVINNMNNLRPQMREALYDLFSNYHNYTIFSNMASYHPVQYQSIEAVHGWVHNYVGGANGHMLAVPWSAFDPSFMLHHTNIDRCFAIWQALNPGSYVESAPQDYSTFMVNSGVDQDVDSPLYPFHSKDDGTYWTSKSARDTKNFFYTYPELQDNPDEAKLKETINSLYGQSTIGHRTKRSDIADTTDSVEQLFQPAQIDPDAAARNEKRFEYTANIKIDKCALDGSGSIYLFLGDFNDEPAAWRTDSHLAGAAPLFVMDSSAMPDAGASKDIYAAVSLTRELERRVGSGELGCMDPSDVVPYLTESLAWRIAKPDGSPVAADQVAGLQISVVKAEYRPASSACEFPAQVGGYETLTQITSGKAGGLAL